MMEKKYNEITDSELLGWAESGVQFYTALFSDGVYPHSRFSGKVCMNEVVKMVATMLQGYYALGMDEAWEAAVRLIGRVRPAVEERIRKEAELYLRNKAVSRILDTAAAARARA